MTSHSIRSLTDYDMHFYLVIEEDDFEDYKINNPMVPDNCILILPEVESRDCIRQKLL